MYKSQFKKQPKSTSAFPCQAGDSFHIKSSLSWLWTNAVKLTSKCWWQSRLCNRFVSQDVTVTLSPLLYYQMWATPLLGYAAYYTGMILKTNIWKFSPVEIENGNFGHFPLYQLLSSLSVVVSFTTRCNDFRFWWQCTYVSLVESSVLFPITILIMKNDRYKSVLLREPGWQRLCPSGTHHLRLPNHKYN